MGERYKRESTMKNSCSVGATGKSRLCSSIIKYSVVDCLDVSTCSYDFFLDSSEQVEEKGIQHVQNSGLNSNSFFSWEFFILLWLWSSSTNDDRQRENSFLSVCFFNSVCVFVIYRISELSFKNWFFCYKVNILAFVGIKLFLIGC